MVAATLFAKPLPDSGTIGVPTPASPFFNRSEVLRGVEWWESRGFRVKLADGALERDAYVAGSPETRARDIMAMFADDEVDVVQCLQGGFGCAQTIPHLDFDLLAAHAKPFLGFSDITALHVALRQRIGLATIYANGLRGMGSPEVSDFSKERLLSVLRGDGSGVVPGNPDDPYVRTLRGGRATGPIAGGCLWLLLQTMGTPWEVEVEGAILFFEDYDAPPWVIDGMLTQLGHAGKLAEVSGVIVGELEKCDWRNERPEWPQTKSVEDVLEEHLEPLGVPVLYGLPLGHGKHLSALPLGVKATLDADAGTVTIDEPALRGDPAA